MRLYVDNDIFIFGRILSGKPERLAFVSEKSFLATVTQNDVIEQHLGRGRNYIKRLHYFFHFVDTFLYVTNC